METILFKYVNAPYGCFSNFSNHSIVVDGIEYKTTEHFFQASKMKNIEDRDFVISMPTPKLAKELARTKPMRENWEEIRVGVMRKALYYKIEQHPIIKTVLLNTKDALIIEDNINDNFWANGNGSGLNILGKLWMEIREDLRSKNGK